MKTLRAYVITSMDSCQISCQMIPHSVKIKDGKRWKWIRSRKKVLQILWRGRVFQIMGNDWDITRSHVAWDVGNGEVAFLELGFDL